MDSVQLDETALDLTCKQFILTKNDNKFLIFFMSKNTLILQKINLKGKIKK